MSTLLLKVEDLTLSTNQGPLIQNLSFAIRAGEIVALTGKSGSGKTSIALAILDLLPRSIRMVGGHIGWKPEQQEKHTLPEDRVAWSTLRGTYIGYTQQDAFGAFDPVMRMGDQMRLVVEERTSHSRTEIEKELRVKMEEVGLHEIDRLWTSYPHQLSGGQLQRCQMAMSIVIRPELLISDEPTSAIDKINQLDLLDVFSMMREKYNMAILCITHEEAVIRHLADREVQIGEILTEYPLPEPVPHHTKGQLPEQVVEAKGLTYRHLYGGMIYKSGATIGPLDFTVSQGNCLGIVGESGSGKSTLAQLLVGLLLPIGGQVFFKGRRIDFLKPSDIRFLRDHVQLVMQDGRGALHPYMTVRRLLTEVLPDPGMKEDDLRNILSNALSEVELPLSVLDRKANQLSGGECLRVNIARSLLLKPVLLICDESTSALDGPTRDGIIALLRHLMTTRGMALMFISHDERIIRGLAQDVVVLSQGVVVEKGEASEVIRYPTHPVTKKIFTTHATFQRKRPLS